MPCVVTEAEARWYESEANKAKFGKAATNLEILTEVACEATRLLAAGKAMTDGSNLLKAWYAQHKAMDEAAEKATADKAKQIELKKKALKKLTAKERKALEL